MNAFRDGQPDWNRKKQRETVKRQKINSKRLLLPCILLGFGLLTERKVDKERPLSKNCCRRGASVNTPLGRLSRESELPLNYAEK